MRNFGDSVFSPSKCFNNRETDWTSYQGDPSYLHTKLMIISRCVSSLTTDSHCGVWPIDEPLASYVVFTCRLMFPNGSWCLLFLERKFCFYSCLYTFPSLPINFLLIWFYAAIKFVGISTFYGHSSLTWSLLFLVNRQVVELGRLDPNVRESGCYNQMIQGFLFLYPDMSGK